MYGGEGEGDRGREGVTSVEREEVTKTTIQRRRGESESERELKT